MTMAMQAFISLACLLSVATSHNAPIWAQQRKGELQHVDVGTVPHHRSRRQASTGRQPIRITPVLDSTSLQMLSAEKQALVTEIADDMVEFFGARYSVNPVSQNILIHRACKNGLYFASKSTPDHLTCQDECVATTCGPFSIQPKHLRACNTCNMQATSCMNGSNSGVGEASSDLVIYVGAKDVGACATTGSTTLAFATNCALEAELDRPIFGAVNLCPNRLSTATHSRNQLLATVRHEMYHVLAMSSSLFAFFRTPMGQPRTPRHDRTGLPNVPNSQYITSTGLGFSFSSNTVYNWDASTVMKMALTWKTAASTISLDTYAVVTPKVLAFVRSHFNCSTLVGALLENQGGESTALSHWEKRVFENEVMTGIVSNEHSYSGLTMALMEDSGWYDANMSYAEPLLWGKNLGCDFVLKSPREWMMSRQSMNKTVAPYCVDTANTGSVNYCDLERRAIARCSLASYSSVLENNYQYFSADLPLAGVAAGDLSKYGGRTPIADYAPFYKGFLRAQSGSNVTRGSQCFEASNAPAPDDNFALEYYGSGSRCINHATVWTRQQGRLISSPSNYGAGCYRTYCQQNQTIHVDVGTQRVNCTSRANENVTFTVTINGGIYTGSIVCPAYTDACYSPTLVSDLPSTVQCISGLTCDPTVDNSAGGRPAVAWFSFLLSLLVAIVTTI